MYGMRGIISVLGLLLIASRSLGVNYGTYFTVGLVLLVLGLVWT